MLDVNPLLIFLFLKSEGLDKGFYGMIKNLLRRDWKWGWGMEGIKL